MELSLEPVLMAGPEPGFAFITDFLSERNTIYALKSFLVCITISEHQKTD